jgi:putative phosphoesterase
MIIGLLTDTHLPNMVRDLDELGPEPEQFFKSVDLILHGGDLIATRVLDWCEQFAPVICADGNNDVYEDPRTKMVQMLEIEGWKIGMIHSLEGEHRPMSDLQKMFPSQVDIMVAGHSHQERLEHREGVVLLNSGSITFPQHKELRLGTVALLELKPDSLHAEIIPIGETPGSPNPGKAMSLDVTRNRTMSD